jgi:hypothetical protein
MALEDFSKYTKITVNPALPKNEKDLICALLAGRLRNLFNGKLFCLNLAIGDLIKDASGYGLTDLVDGLKGLQGSLGDLQKAIGYDKILGSINSALGGIGTVFSLGGLCPSPIRPPQIPDIMPMVNAQLFGQGMNIINALGKVANPNMCFGGGPGGFGVNYNSMPGALQQLKNALNNAANDPAGLKSVGNYFSQNLKMQQQRLNSELNRLGENLSDPFGIKLAKQRADAIRAAHTRGADYKVVDSRGIERPNALASMLTVDTMALLDAKDTAPILYKREAVLNYCGEEVGIKLVPVSGNIDYAGWDTNPATDNSDRPFGQHVLPTPADSYYDYIIKEEYNNILVTKYNSETKVSDTITSLNLTRGKFYRIKLALVNYTASVNAGNTVWVPGLEYSNQGPTGNVVYEQGDNLIQGELDWAVSIENPTTPDVMSLVFSNGTTLPIVVNGPTSIPVADKTHNLADLVHKAVFFQQEVDQVVGNTTIPVVTPKTDIRFNCTASLVSSKYNYASTQSLAYNNAGGANTYRFIADPDSADASDKILEVNTVIGPIKYNSKLYVNDASVATVKRLAIQVQGTSTSYTILELDAPLTVINDIKLPYKTQYTSRISTFGSNKLLADEMYFELLNDTTVRWYLTNQHTANSVENGKMLNYYDIDITDPTNPILTKMSVEIKLNSVNLKLDLTKIA